MPISIALAGVIIASVSPAEDFGNVQVFHEDLLVWECTDPAPPEMRHIAYECNLWRYNYGVDEGDE